MAIFNIPVCVARGLPTMKYNEAGVKLSVISETENYLRSQLSHDCNVASISVACSPTNQAVPMWLISCAEAQLKLKADSVFSG